MSVWSYVYGTITIDASGRDDAETDYFVSRIIGSLPPVTGSDGNMAVHVVKPSMPDSWINADIYMNPLDRTKYPEGVRKDTSQRILLVEGDLRYRTFNETNREFSKWLSRLANRCLIDNILVAIRDDIGYQQYIYDYRKCGSWLDGLYEPIWLHELRNGSLRMNDGKSTRALYYQGYDRDWSDFPILYHLNKHIYSIDDVHEKTYHKLDRYESCGYR